MVWPVLLTLDVAYGPGWWVAGTWSGWLAIGCWAACCETKLGGVVEEVTPTEDAGGMGYAMKWGA